MAFDPEVLSGAARQRMVSIGRAGRLYYKHDEIPTTEDLALMAEELAITHKSGTRRCIMLTSLGIKNFATVRSAHLKYKKSLRVAGSAKQGAMQEAIGIDLYTAVKRFLSEPNPNRRKKRVEVMRAVIALVDAQNVEGSTHVGDARQLDQADACS
jgi:hypothetical protein